MFYKREVHTNVPGYTEEALRTINYIVRKPDGFIRLMFENEKIVLFYKAMPNEIDDIVNEVAKVVHDMRIKEGL